MSGGEEWGPWIEHGGKGCPLVQGSFVEVRYYDGRQKAGICEASASWSWDRPVRRLGGYAPIVAYRVRKPRGLVILEALLADLPTPTERERA